MKKYFIIILFSIALNFSFQPVASIVFEKHRIAIEINSRNDKSAAEVLTNSAVRKIEIRSRLFLEIALADKIIITAFDTS